MSNLRDSGERTNFESGATREMSISKGRYVLIPPVLLRRLAQHYAAGAAKYSERNWEKGIADSSCYDSMLRHANHWLEGDQAEDHLAAIIWNAAALMQNEEYPAYNGIHDLNMPWRLRKPRKWKKGRTKL